MFLLPQDTTSMILLLIALGLIVFSVRAMLRAMYKKAKRALSKRYFAGLISGKALLIGTLLLGGGDDVQTLLRHTPSPFQQFMLASDFDLDVKDNRILFSKEKAISGYVQFEEQRATVFLTAEISYPQSVQTVCEAVNAFAPSAQAVSAIQELIRQKVNRRIPLPNGYVEVNGSNVKVQLDRPLATPL
jgi:hypothetical protein